MSATNQKEYHREWYRANKARLQPYKRGNMRRYRAENPQKFRDQTRVHKRRIRERLLAMYGNICALCGFDNVIALTLDHIGQNGNQERKALGERGVYLRALEKHRPDEYRMLCMNCQFITRQQWLNSHGRH